MSVLQAGWDLRVTWACMIAIGALSMGCKPGPAGEEFQINTYTSGNQRAWPEAPGSAAMDANGNFVVVWSSSSQDGSDFGVYGQRFNAAGRKQGGEFRVNSTTTGAQRFATVAMDADGNFVVTWTSADASGTGIFAQRYNAAGQPQGGEFAVNTTTTNDQKWSVVAMNADGAFVVAWTSLNTGTPYPDVYARRFSAAGTPQGNDFVVADSFTDQTEGEHGYIFPSTAIDDAGNFVVVYTEYTAQTYIRLHAERYSSSGALLGDTIVIQRVPPEPANDFRHSGVDMDADGNFVVVWTEFESLIRAKRFSLAGTALTGFIDVDLNSDFNLYPRVALDDDNNFVVCWDRQNPQDTYDVFARTYTAAGAPSSNAFLVNTTTASQQQFSSVAMAPDGDYVIVWTADNNQDGSNTGMFGQRYAKGGAGATNLTQLIQRAIPGRR